MNYFKHRGWLFLFITLTMVSQALGQGGDRIKPTWNGPPLSELFELLGEDAKTSRAKPASEALTVVQFKPAGDSGVTQSLAEALGRSPQEIASLKDAFAQVKQGYEEEVAKEGKSNNLAAALTFFIAANVMAYQQIEVPSDEDSEQLFSSLQRIMFRVPAFAEMSNDEKQKMHDWLVCMGGLAMTNYLDAKKSGDAKSMATMKQLADYSMRLVLGVDVSKLSFRSHRLTLDGVN
jgi:hypothetical protein